MSEQDDHKSSLEEHKFIDRFDDVVLGMFAFAERGLLLLIGALAIVAVGFELGALALKQDINLADLLLLFIYLEVGYGLRVLFHAQRTCNPAGSHCYHWYHAIDTTQQGLRTHSPVVRGRCCVVTGYCLWGLIVGSEPVEARTVN